MDQILCSQNKYSRQDALKIIQSRRWYQNSDQEIRTKINEIPDDFQGFLNDLVDRGEDNEFYSIIKITNIYWDDRYAIPQFEVKSKRDGKDYVNSYIAWRKGIYHSLRGLVLIETEGEISHFLIRKSVRFAAQKEVYESIGSIYPPRDIEEKGPAYEFYLQTELSGVLRIPDLKISRLYDLGQIYPDIGMSDNIVKLFAAQIEVGSIETIDTYINGKRYNDKRYDYGFEVIPIGRLLKFLAETNDSFLLSIFGRLQALNVIKL